MLKLTKEQKGYIAGIVDGEGNISLHRGYHTLKNGEKRDFYHPFIKIANTNVELLIWIKEKLHCGYLAKNKNRNPDKWKTTYVLTFGANAIRAILPEILDCLIVKKRQALLLLEYLKMSKRGRPRYFRFNNNNKYLAYYETLKKLNFRGANEEEAEFGGTPTLKLRQEDNTEPSRDLFSGVCNDYGVSLKSIQDDIV